MCVHEKREGKNIAKRASSRIDTVDFRTLGQLKIKRTPQPFCRIELL